jgi:hypothetical protein
VTDENCRLNEFPREMAHILSRLQRLREDADYQTAMRFDREMAMEARQSLLAFHSETESFLRKKGFIA